jgi:ribosomal protein L12E/L44/L45/RPP1/RPP2
MTTDRRAALTPDALRAMTLARGLELDDETLDAIVPMVADLFELADVLKQWADRQDAVSVGAAPLPVAEPEVAR